MPTSPVAELVALPPGPDRRAYLDGAGLADAAGLGTILDGVESLVHEDPATADELAELCAVTAGPGQLDTVRARACYIRARIATERGELDRALVLIEQARVLWLAADHRLAALRTDLGRMQVLDDLGRHAVAAAVGAALIDALDDLAVDAEDEELRRWMQAAALENVGVACGLVGDHERALDAYGRAEATYRDLGMEEETARPLANRGVELLEFGRGREALELLVAAGAVFTAAGDRLWAAKCLGHLAQAHEQLGQPVDALRALESARTTLDELGAEAEAARTQLAIAHTYLGVGLADEAAIEAASATERTTAAGMVHDAALARFTGALAHLHAGRTERARDELDAAVTLFDKVGDAQHQARARLATAEIAAAEGRLADAYKLATHAARALEEGGWLVPLTWSELRLADFAVDDEVATRHLVRAGTLARQLRLPPLRFPWMVRTARLRRRQGHRRDAMRLLRAAIADVERRGSSLPDVTLRRATRDDGLAAHDELVDILADGPDADVGEALRMSERSKSQQLDDLRLRTLGAPADTVGAPSSELAELRIDLDAAYGALLTAGPRGAVALRRRADELERRLTSLRLRAAVAGPSVTSAPDAMASGGIAADTVALALHVVGDDVLAFVIRNGDVAVERLVGTMPEVAIELDRLAAQWARFRMGGGLADRHRAALADAARQVLRSLHELLVAPVEHLLRDAAHESLVVVPHRRLHEVPFHALHDGQAHLLERWAVTVSSSVTTDRVRGRRDATALVLAVPDAQAPSVGAEASALADLLPAARVEVGDDATTAVLFAAVPGPDIVHLACHGLYRAANPLFSSLRLADRWMTAAEVLTLDLDGALVTLSACESGRQRAATAEHAGLAWAFLAAGARGVVASQWLVDDAATAALMAAFYGGIVTGREPAEALRRAQLAVAADEPHPYFWAPFAFVAPPAQSDRRVA